ncbi:hypothetical protein [Aquimarina sp. 2201CG5-10]|uniref:hypothetical protein n=1 Tax=Aquimarina callyspongiae TaxID=3098150 RepID=UPI002AB5D609|nr:hypothetical protein [Aquimarina sp. 2201CG5-10]MDY8138901.1 hypothetical protein [Aquimarina sp. 2201CG5-10]
MNNRFKKMVRFLLYVLTIGMMITSCTQDDDHQPVENVLKAYSYHDYKKLNKSKRLETQVTKIKSQNTDLRKSGTTESFYFIDTKTVQILEAEEYVNYTFRATRFPVDLSIDHNYVLTLYNDGSFHQMYVSYPILEDGSYDIANLIGYPIDGDALVQKSGSCGTLTEVQVWQSGVDCIDFNCTAGGNHSPGQSCSGDPDEQPIQICSGAWVTQCVEPDVDGQGSSGSGGGGNQGNNNSSNGPIGITPFLEPGVDKGNDELMEQTNLPEVKAMIQYLKGQVNTLFREDGRMFNMARNSNGVLSVTEEIDPERITKGYVQFPAIDPNTLVKIHLHNKFKNKRDKENHNQGRKRKPTVPLFSSHDITEFISFFNTREAINPPRGEHISSQEISSILVADKAVFINNEGNPTGTETSGIYALKISDPARVRELRETFDTEEKREKFNDQYPPILVNGCKFIQNTGCFLANQINYLNNYDNGRGFGIQLYMAIEIDGEIVAWQPL